MWNPWTALRDAAKRRGVAGAVTRALADEKDVTGVQDGPTNAEQRIGVQVAVTTERLDEKAAKALRRLGDALLGAVATGQIALDGWDRAHSGDQQLERQQREQAAHDRRVVVYGQPVDLARPLISRRQLAVAELFFVLAEIVFWYMVFGRDIEPTDPWYSISRIGPAILAVLVPLFGLMAARSAGGSWQRTIRHPATEPAERRFQRAGTAASTVLLIAAALGVFMLVDWRYDEGVTLGALALPGFWMSWLFAGILLGDAIGRAFCTSELADTDHARAREVAADRARIGALSARLTGDLRGWHTAWNALRFQVDTTMDAVARVVLTGEGMVLAARARRADRPAASPELAEATSPVQTSRGAERAGYALPSAEQPEHLDLGLLRPVLRALRSAVDLLTEHVPPALATGVAPREELARLARRVAALEQAAGTGEPAEAGDETPLAPHAVAEEVPAPRQPAEDDTADTDGVLPYRLTGSTD